MNRKRLLLIGALSLILAMLVSMVVYRLLNVAVSAANRPSESIVVAAADIAPGARIDEKDIRVVRMPVGDIPEGGFHSIAEVAGRGVVVPMARNEPVLLSKLAPEQAGAGLPALIPNGMRAVSVKVNEVVSVAGFVVPDRTWTCYLPAIPAVTTIPPPSPPPRFWRTCRCSLPGSSCRRTAKASR